MVGTDLGYLGHLYRIVAVVTDWMMRVRDANLRIGTIALLARELERDNPGDIGLKGKNLEVEHELRVVGERRGNTDRPIEIGRLVVRHRFLGPLDLTLDVTNAVQILIQARAIGTAYAPLEAGDVLRERIEEACPI